MISAISPNQEGVVGTDSEEVWIHTETSAILVMSTYLLGTVLFFLIKEAYFYAGSLLVTSRCAIRGPHGFDDDDPTMLACHCPLWRLPGPQKRWPAGVEDPVARMAAYPNAAGRCSSCTFPFSIKLVITSQAPARGLRPPAPPAE